MSKLTLSIRHTTHYAFTQPVVHALQRLRLTPKETQGQRIVDWRMTFDNAHAELQYDDQHFNHVTLISLSPGAGAIADWSLRPAPLPCLTLSFTPIALPGGLCRPPT